MTADDGIGTRRDASEDEQEDYELFKIAVSTYLAGTNTEPTNALSFLANLIGEYCGEWSCSTEQHEKILELSRQRFRQVSALVISRVTKN